MEEFFREAWCPLLPSSFSKGPPWSQRDLTTLILRVKGLEPLFSFSFRRPSISTETLRCRLKPRWRSSVRLAAAASMLSVTQAPSLSGAWWLLLLSLCSADQLASGFPHCQLRFYFCHICCQLSLVRLLSSFQNLIILISLILFLMGLCILFSPYYIFCGIWQAVQAVKVNKYAQSATFNRMSLPSFTDYLKWW